MAYIFMDESGCLGFDFSKKKTSKHFIITFLLVNNRKILDKIVNKTFIAIPAKKRKTHPGSLHCNKEDNKTRAKLFSLIRDKDVSVMVIYLNKQKVYTKLQDEKSVLYNYVVNILLDRLARRNLLPIKDKIILIASQRETNRFLNENFKHYLETQISANHKILLDVLIKPASASKGLQVVDFISWAIFRKCEYGDDYFYNMIKNLIIEESSLFG